MTTRYVALLRGINVGGNNLIKMPALKACFEKQGFRDVVTYIASGNVLFSADEPGSEKLARLVEGAVAATFKCTASVVLRSKKQLREIVARAPDGFGSLPDKFRYDVIYLKAPLTVSVAMKTVQTAPGVDEAHAGVGVLYFSRLISQATRSRLGKVAATPIYKNLTIRNWNTTTTLVRMMEDVPSG